MKIQIKNIYIILVFLFANVLLLSALFFLFFSSQKMHVQDININLKNAILPFVNKDIKNIYVNSKAFIIYEPDSRVVIAGKNETLRFSPASTAKIMTAYVSLKEYGFNTVLVASGVDAVEGSKMKLAEGERMTVENLLYGLMLPSGNDAAYVLAEAIPGGKHEFVKKMNDEARRLNLNNSHFVDPAGFEDDNYTTAFDLARLAAEAMKNDNFKKIVGTSTKTVYDISGLIGHDLKNLNELLGHNGVNGVKTGYTDEAGGVLVSSISQEGKKYIIVVLNTPDRFGDTNNIILNAVKNINLVSF